MLPWNISSKVRYLELLRLLEKGMEPVIIAAEQNLEVTVDRDQEEGNRKQKVCVAVIEEYRVLLMTKERLQSIGNQSRNPLPKPVTRKSFTSMDTK